MVVKMTTLNVKFNAESITDDDEKQAFLSLLEQHQSTKKGAKYDSQAVMKDLITAYAKSLKIGMTRGVTSKVSDRIEQAVQTQMELNKHSKKYILVGSGENQERVYFEKKALTPKKIADLGGFNLNSVKDWLKQGSNAEMIEQHNKDVLGVETSEQMKVFNLTTGRSNRTADSRPDLVQQDD